MAEPPAPEHTFGSADVAAYVAALSGDLATMARQNGLEVLDHLLQMVQLEAENLGQACGD